MQKAMQRAMRCLLVSFLITGYSAHAAEKPLLVSSAWTRELPPGQNTAAIYMQLRNASDALVQVQGVRVDSADSASIHQSAEERGMMSMRAVPVLKIAPGAKVELQPGGYHVMVFGLRNPARTGGQLAFCLLLQGGDEQCSVARVKGLED